MSAIYGRAGVSGQTSEGKIDDSRTVDGPKGGGAKAKTFPAPRPTRAASRQRQQPSEHNQRKYQLDVAEPLMGELIYDPVTETVTAPAIEECGGYQRTS